MLQSFRRQDIGGFTLIETLVTLIIIGVMAAIATPSLLTWYNNKKIEDVMAQVEGALKIAQSASVRFNTSCSVTLNNQTITATPSKCLQSSTFVRDANANIATEGVGESAITFTNKGTASLVEDKSIIVIYDADNPTGRQMKCIVVSDGVGLMRTGDYNDTSPPGEGADVDATEARCVTPL